MLEKRIMRWVSSFSLAMLGLSTVFCPGCVGRLIGESAEGTLGPKGVYWEEQPVATSKSEKSLSDYRRFELEEVINGYGKHVPVEFFRRLPVEFNKQLASSGLPNAASGKTLVFRVTIIHYETADMDDNVFGPLEQVVARVELVDKDSGRVLATGNAVGRTGKTVGLGAESKAEGLAKALIKWVRDYYRKGEGRE